jgi:phosphatidylglycerophosphate synthase
VLATSTTTIRDRVDRQLAAAAGAQVALLAALSVQVGLGVAGWLAGAAYAAGLWTLLAGAARRDGTTTLGPADLVTLARASLVAGVVALVVNRFVGGAASVTVLVVLAAVALVLDGVDGQVARRTGTVSALGARFDMEVDAFLVLVLSVHVAVLVSPWAVVIGGMRYAYVAASWALPWLRGALPTRYSAKVVAAVVGIVLVVLSAEVVPHTLAVALVGVALLLLVRSFGQSVAWLWRAERGRAERGRAERGRAERGRAEQGVRPVDEPGLRTLVR